MYHFITGIIFWIACIMCVCMCLVNGLAAILLPETDGIPILLKTFRHGTPLPIYLFSSVRIVLYIVFVQKFDVYTL